MRNKGVRTTAPGGRELSADVRFGLVLSVRKSSGYRSHRILRWYDGVNEANVYALVQSTFSPGEGRVGGTYYEVWHWVGDSRWECIDPDVSEDTKLSDYEEGC